MPVLCADLAKIQHKILEKKGDRLLALIFNIISEKYIDAILVRKITLQKRAIWNKYFEMLAQKKQLEPERLKRAKTQIRVMELQLCTNRFTFSQNLNKQSAQKCQIVYH